MESSLVIKVKHEDTLRRFSACVTENNQLDLDMVGLRAKICSLFNFTADANVILRYVDEDGDVVTLVDDDDLHDIMRQRLPFLRIDVHMSNGNAGKPNYSFCGNPTPLRSPQVTDPFQSGNVDVADVWKSVQEPLNDTLSNLCLVSKAASSANPVFAKLADTFSKVGKTILNSHSQPSVATGPSTKKGTPREHAIPKAKGQPSTHVKATFTDFGSRSAQPPFCSHYQPHVIPGAGGIPQPNYVDSTAGIPFHAFADFVSKIEKPVGNSHYQWPHDVVGIPGEHVTPEERGQQSTYVGKSSNGIQPVETGNVIRDSLLRGAPVDLNIPPFDVNSSQSANVNITPLSPAVPDVNAKNGTAPANDSFAQKVKNSGTREGKNNWISSSSAPPNNGSNWTNSNAYIKLPAFPCHSTALFGKSSGTSSSTAPADSSNSTSSTAVVKPPIYTGDLGAPSSRTLYINTRDHAMSSNGIIHRGVQCDGCGIYPIVGSRFKSKVKENYDLCSICFNTMGNVADYNRIDHLHPRYLSASAQTLKLARPKLDSQFILDVNVIDGTMMAPSTAFTKIWRIRNNGSLVWPIGTQLVWIGGDKFSDSHLVDLQVPKEGVPVDKELDIAVDFIAPRLPGRYISYWRMASPSGQKFGQRVWVLIQVDASLKESFYDRSQGLNLNIPLDVSSSKGPQLIDINLHPTEDHIPNAHLDPVDEMVDDHLIQVLLNDLNRATDAAASASATSAAAASSPATSAAAASSPATSAAVASAPATLSAAASARTIAPPSVLYPNIYFSETAPAVPSSQQSAVDLPSSSLGVGVNNSVEETLLKQLEEMGFKEVNYNREILRMNDYNLEQSVDYLCGVYVRDPILEELHEMGFRDNDMNKKLLIKNNGSIKGVVMDLLNGEQA